MQTKRKLTITHYKNEAVLLIFRTKENLLYLQVRSVDSQADIWHSFPSVITTSLVESLHLLNINSSLSTLFYVVSPYLQHRPEIFLTLSLFFRFFNLFSPPLFNISTAVLSILSVRSGGILLLLPFLCIFFSVLSMTLILKWLFFFLFCLVSVRSPWSALLVFSPILLNHRWFIYYFVCSSVIPSSA